MKANEDGAGLNKGKCDRWVEWKVIYDACCRDSTLGKAWIRYLLQLEEFVWKSRN